MNTWATALFHYFFDLWKTTICTWGARGFWLGQLSQWQPPDLAATVLRRFRSTVGSNGKVNAQALSRWRIACGPMLQAAYMKASTTTTSTKTFCHMVYPPSHKVMR